LDEIKNALNRIEAGKFGLCLNCEQEISANRLKAIPWVRYCITCQEMLAIINAVTGSRGMDIEHIVLAICLGSALVLAMCAIGFSAKRVRIIIPAAGLLVLGLYELAMDRWEKTVRAPIRLDLFLEIPVTVVFIVWGGLIVVYSRRKPRVNEDHRKGKHDWDES
jgi:Prokaryotic dksA/traR C4-type zinc finger